MGDSSREVLKTLRGYTKFFDRGSDDIRDGVDSWGRLFGVDPSHRDADEARYDASTARSRAGQRRYENEWVREDTRGSILGVDQHRAQNWAERQHEELDRQRSSFPGYGSSSFGGYGFQNQSADGTGPDASMYDQAVLRQDGRMTAPQVGGGTREAGFGVSPAVFAAREQFAAAQNIDDGFFTDTYKGGIEGSLPASAVVTLRDKASELDPQERIQLAHSLDFVGRSSEAFALKDASPEQIAAGLSAMAASLPRNERKEFLARLENGDGFERIANFTNKISDYHLATLEAQEQSQAAGRDSRSPAPDAAQRHVSEDVMDRGDKGGSVKAVQNLLMEAGLSVGPTGADGNFGKNTEAATIKAGQLLEGMGVSTNMDSGIITSDDMTTLIQNLPKLQEKTGVAKT